MDYDRRFLNFKNDSSERWVVKTEGLQSLTSGNPGIPNHKAAINYPQLPHYKLLSVQFSCHLHNLSIIKNV